MSAKRVDIKPGRQYRIVETDNFGGDYPNESFVNIPDMTHEHAETVCAAINKACTTPSGPQHYNVVDAEYVLAPGFEP